MRRAVALCLPLLLAACASAPTNSGFLSSYEGMAKKTGTVRATVNERRAAEKLRAVTRVAIAPTQMVAKSDWLTPEERTALLREVDAQLCFELSKRYVIAPDGDAEAASVRAAVTGVEATGRAASVASAAANFFIPGPIGLRAPGTLGALRAEAEMFAPSGQEQLAAISWSRTATAVGADKPSLSRIGDALQFAGPFADAAAKVMSPDKPTKQKFTAQTDPCATYGPRFRPAGWAAKAATGLYVPSLSGAEAASKP